ncbi:Threonine synthase [Methanimicrococcus stummii]|uniref:Cysteate synthase n=1 Tax=Methanimicrococcus stummii TaxID=3028294 RepID=A0AA96V8A1_9EURY|nr:Threonine synthase [Methanimicrococcus sp. Es2]
MECCNHFGLLQTVYQNKQFSVRPELPGLFRYFDWLPVSETIPTTACPITFQNKNISKTVGLPNLWFTFTGWAPEIGAYAKTGSFKELEAYPTLSRAPHTQSIVVASAGNTGRAFAQACTETGASVVLLVPETSLDSLWTVTPAGPNIKLIAVSGDYSDAIRLSEKLCASDGFVSEGGAKNVARRDGMGTVMLNAAETIGRLPNRYFQAVGSGTGGIAAWEASKRLIQDGRFGSSLPKLHLIQNQPFTPMFSAWKRGSRDINASDFSDSSIASVYSPVLTNRTPPYGIPGGVFDAMCACGGDISAVDNSSAKESFRIFENETGIDLDPAAAVAFAGLIQAAENGIVCANETIVLNLTGGGFKKIEEDLGKIPIDVAAAVSSEFSANELKEVLK